MVHGRMLKTFVQQVRRPVNSKTLNDERGTMRNKHSRLKYESGSSFHVHRSPFSASRLRTSSAACEVEEIGGKIAVKAEGRIKAVKHNQHSPPLHIEKRRVACLELMLISMALGIVE